VDVQGEQTVIQRWYGLWQQASAAVDLALLAVQAGSRLVGNVVGEPASNESRRNKMLGGEPPGM
jgi:hypothetical protein